MICLRKDCERNHQIHGKLQPILNLSYSSKQAKILISSQSNESCGGRMYSFHGNCLSPAGSVNLIPAPD